MKAFKLVLTVSLVVNLILAFIVLKRPAPAGTPTSVGASIEGTSVSAGLPKRDEKQNTRAESRRAGLWEKLRNGSFQEMTQRLREAGFPHRLIVAIVTGVASERMKMQFDELRPEGQASQPYWKADQSVYDDPKKREALMKLQREQHEQLTAALGDNYWLTEERYIDMARGRYGELPAEKLHALGAIENDYRELQRKIYEDAQKDGTVFGKLDGDKLRLLEADQRADIAKLLTPEELLEFDLRSSRSASMLRSDTGFLQLSEEEFRSLFPAYQAAGERLEAMNFSSPAERNAAKLSFDAEVQTKVKELLDPERFADYLQAKDPTSKKLNLIVQRLDLPLSAARAVVAVQDEVTQRAAAILSDTTLTAEQRATQLAGLAQEASAKINGSLGERGYAAYLENNGKWLRGMQGAGNLR